MDKKISVITICKNAGIDLERTIESVLSQSIKPYEYIVVDGLSTDATTLRILDEYADKVDCIIHEEDDGISDALNKGIAQVKGEYILSVNAGDQLDRYCISLLEEMLDGKHDVYRCHQTIKSIKSGKTHIRYPSCKYSRLPFTFRSCHMGTVVRKSAYSTFGGYDTSFKIAMDEELLFRFHRLGASETTLDINVGTFYTGGISYASSKEKISEKLRIQEMTDPTIAQRVIYRAFVSTKALVKAMIMENNNDNKT